MEVQISDIKIEGRFRKDFGDIQGLADSIAKNGLLHPPIIDANYRLIDGERRIRAHELLGRDRIEARIVNVPSLLEAEHDANEFGKAWTPSEKVAIARAIEEEMGDRRRFNADGGPRIDESISNNCYESIGKRSDEIAAEKAGFGSHMTYRRAKRVVDKGVPELVEAMDAKDLSVTAASEVALLPKEEQVKKVAEAREAKEKRDLEKDGDKPKKVTAQSVKDESQQKKEKKPKDQEKPKPNPDAHKEGIFPAMTVAYQVELRVDTISWNDPNAIAALDYMIEYIQGRKNDILKRYSNEQ